MAILVIAEHNNTSLKPATLNTITAAKALGDDVHVLVAGSNSNAVAEEVAKVTGVTKVLTSDDAAYEHHLAENVAPLVAKVAPNYSHILTAGTTTGQNLMPRVSALLDVQQISDIISVESENTFKRPIYAGNAIATVQIDEPIKVLTVRSTAFDKAEMGQDAAPIEKLDSTGDAGLTIFISQELTVSDRPELTAARIVISGGRGMGSEENFKMIEELADQLGAAIGASRAAVDAGFVPNDYQVGQTGKKVAPDLYIAVGISGAIQHLAGMKDSKTIVAINKDEDAPIFQVADYGIVGTWEDVLPKLKEELTKVLGNDLKKKGPDATP